MPATYGGAASSPLPDAPADVLLDAGSPQQLVYLGASGEGGAIPFEDAVETGATDLLSTLAGGTPAAGSLLAADGAGGLQIASVPSVVTIPLFAYATADSATPTVQGLASFTPSDYAITGRTTVLALVAVGSVTSGSQTGTLEVLNASGTVVATLTWTETTPTRKTASITLPGSAEIYRARVSCSGVTNPLTDYALLGGAHLRITWS